MQLARRTSPVFIGALAVTALVVTVAGLMLFRTLHRSAEAPAGPAMAGSAGREPPSPPSGASPRPVPSLPRLLAPSPLRWELVRAAVTELTPAQQAWLADLGQQARRQAAVEVGLTPREQEAVEAVHRATDARLADLEARVDDKNGTLAGDVQGELHAGARAELAALTGQLGEARARALRAAENRAYRERWAATSGDDVSPALKSQARRRMTFLWMGMADETTNEDDE